MELLYVKYNRERKEKYQIKTTIYENENEKYVVKEAINIKSKKHISNMLSNWEKMKKIYPQYDISKPELKKDKIYFKFEEGVTLLELVQEAAQKKNKEELDRLFNLYINILIGFDESNLGDFKYSDEFERIFGKIEGLEKSKCLKITNVDLNLDNIILENDKIKIIDYEWVFDFPIPLDFVIYRNLMQLYANNTELFNEDIFSKYLKSLKDLKILGGMFYAFNKEVFNIEDIDVEYSQILERYIKKNKKLDLNSIQLYYKTEGGNYNEGNSITKHIEKNELETYEFDLSAIDNISEIRLDPIDNYGKFKIYDYELVGEDGEKLKINKIAEYGVITAAEEDFSICYTKDSQIYFSIENINNVKLKCFRVDIQCLCDNNSVDQLISQFNLLLDNKKEEIVNYKNIIEINNRKLELDKKSIEDKEKIINEKDMENRKLNNELIDKNNEINALNDQIQLLNNQKLEIENEINSILNSNSWKITKIFRIMGKRMKENKIGSLIIKTAKSLKNMGVKQTIRKTKLYLERQKNIKEFQKSTGVNLNQDSNESCKVFDAWYEENQDYSNMNTDIKTLAMYLPQFHTFPENDEWWGKGFTEWVNTEKAKPRFADHYQPRKPHEDIGYYDLSDIETLRKQAALAKQHGIYGFCFYYYWFSGKRLMEKPVDLLIAHPEIDINFCLCWANENWTRAWDGQNKSVLIAQEYSEEDEINFIKDMKKYIDDKRYIRVDGKPVIIVYNPGQIPNIKRAFETWRKCARELGIGEILIWTCQTANNNAENLKIEDIIDAEVEFPPHNMWFDIIGERNIDLSGKEACIYNYRKLVEILKNRDNTSNSKPIYRTSMLGWDNAARRENNWVTFYEFSLKSYYEWLSLNIDYTRRNFKENERFMFINAWNEWAEGTYLEPDMKYGYAYLNTTSKALMDLPFKDDLEIVTNSYENKSNTHPRIAMQIHLFYLETIDEIISYVNNIPYDFDCLITTNTKEKAELIKKVFDEKCKSKKNIISITQNRGRDVLPLLMQVKEVIDEYDYICHIHSKKTNTSDYGDYWRKYLYNNLLGSSKFVGAIIDTFESSENLGVIFPETYPILSKMAVWGGNKMCCQQVLDDLGCNVELDSIPIFPVGNMFWFRVNAVRKIFERGYNEFNFPEEQGQVNATLAHGIERLWVYLAKDSGYTYKKMINYTYDESRVSNKKKIAFFVHYDKDDVLSEEDIHYIKELKKVMNSIVFITNSNLKEDDLKLIKSDVDRVIKRDNIGFDFGAWKDGINKFGYDNLEEYDELYLINNSCYGPIYDLNTVICDMEEENSDFWGITYFPYSSDGSYINRDHIDEHIQSYFMAFNKKVFLSECFKEFWDQMKEIVEFKDAIAEGETRLTHYLQENGFKYSVYIKESELLMRYLNNYRLIYEKPSYYLLLKCPFIKKKCNDYISLEEKNRIKKINSLNKG